MQVSSNHDDWVSSVAVLGDLVLTGCYDNTVNIWSVAGTKTLVIPGHTQPVKTVAWLARDTFVSGGQDQVVNMFRWCEQTNSVEMLNCCRGHERSVECVGVAPGGGAVFATGSWDNTVKMWSGNMVTEAADTAEAGETQPKRSKGGGVTRTPLQTLGGHKEAVSGLAWLDANTLASASWDHTIKVWDMELGGLQTELVGNKAFFSVSYSPQCGGLLASSADRSVRMYDPRASRDGAQIVTAVFTSHTGWVSRVTWCAGSQHSFATASHDNLVKVWDARSFRTPLYDLTGHSDNVLSCDWSNPEYIASGGADNDMKIFKSKIS